MAFKKIKRYRIYEDVLAKLKNYLLKKNIHPGKKLPSERELARMFKVNQVSMRGALSILEANGMITRTIGEETFHAGASAYTASSIINLIKKNQNLIIEPLQVRRILEPKIARLASTCISKEQLKCLDALLKQQKEILSTEGDLIDLDRKFHCSIAISTGNSIFGGIIEALHNSFMGSRYESPLSPERMRNGYLSHKKIYSALKRRDPDQAEEAMFEHLLQVEQSAITNLNNKIMTL